MFSFLLPFYAAQLCSVLLLIVHDIYIYDTYLLIFDRLLPVDWLLMVVPTIQVIDPNRRALRKKEQIQVVTGLRTAQARHKTEIERGRLMQFGTMDAGEVIFAILKQTKILKKYQYPCTCGGKPYVRRGG